MHVGRLLAVHLSRTAVFIWSALKVLKGEFLDSISSLPYMVVQGPRFTYHAYATAAMHTLLHVIHYLNTNSTNLHKPAVTHGTTVRWPITGGQIEWEELGRKKGQCTPTLISLCRLTLPLLHRSTARHHHVTLAQTSPGQPGSIAAIEKHSQKFALCHTMILGDH